MPRRSLIPQAAPLLLLMTATGCAMPLGFGPSPAEVLREERLEWSAAYAIIHEEGGIPNPFEPEEIRQLRCRRGSGLGEAICDYQRILALRRQDWRRGVVYRRQGETWRLR